MKQGAKIYRLDDYRPVVEEAPAQRSLVAVILETLLAIPSAIVIGICLALLALPLIFAVVYVGGLLAILSILSLVAVTIALIIDRCKKK